MSAFGVEVKEGCVCVFPPGTTKRLCLDQLVDAVAKTDAVKNVEALRQAVYEREAQKSTGIGGGVGIPHVRIDSITEPILGVGVSKTGIDFDADDKQPVRIVILFAMPKDSNKLYLGLLAQVMVALKAPGFADRLVACGSPEELLAILNE